MKKSALTTEEYNKKKNEIDIEKGDIQALITRGYKQLNAACYILLQIRDNKQAKKYFNWLIENKKITTADIPHGSNDPITAVQIAFTGSGLNQLKLSEKILPTFSREFLEGMSHVDSNKTEIKERSILLGDTGNNNPENWWWGTNQSGKRVDCLLMLYARDNEMLQKLKNEVYEDQKENGLTEVYLAKAYENKSGGRKEHFGFADGISQPIIKGLSKSMSDDEKFSHDNEEVINSGEFILGYENEYNNYSPSPYVDDCESSKELDNSKYHKGKKDLGKNGTYLVFRQMEQHVERFWNFHYEKSKESAATSRERAVKLAAKMIGRWPNGQSLVTHKTPTCAEKESLNDFFYNAMDKDGVNCPYGAHARRVNPRDDAHAGRGPENSLEVSNKHRMLRRGRSYGEPLDEEMNTDNMIKEAQNFAALNNNSGEQNGPTPIKRGLHFICLVSDIGRQFEFIQNVWANTSTFADLCNEVDPVISPRPTPLQPHCNEFTTPQKIIRNRYMNVPEFTTVVGGEYFFMPGIKALTYIMK